AGLGAAGDPLARPALEPRADPPLRRRGGVRPGDAGWRWRRHRPRRIRPDRRREGGPAALPEDPRQARRRPVGSHGVRARGDPEPDREAGYASRAGHPRPGPDLRVADRSAARRRRLRYDRDGHPADEGNARARRRAGARAGRGALTRWPVDGKVVALTADRRRESIDDLDALLASLPQEIVDAVHALPEKEALIEVVLDLGRRPEARFPDSEVMLLDREIDETDIAHVVDHIGLFGDDNRAGIERTLHRISAIRNRSGKIVGLTLRIGRAVYGTIEIINDFVETGKSILIMGRPGIGKTTMLREAARVLADDMGKRVVVVDTSNEIAGDGDIPHPAIGKARRMQVRTPSMQHEVMIEAVENHMPQVIVIDEIGTELEAQAARTIAERGVQLIGTA